MNVEYATYQTTPSKDGTGTFFYPDCCKQWIYSIKGNKGYHGCLCPNCFSTKHKYTVLYMRGTDEANKIMEERRENGS